MKIFALAAIAQAAASSSNWVLIEKRDPVTDLRSASTAVLSTSGEERLVVKCDGVGEPVVSVQFITKKYLGGSNERAVTIRFNQAPPLTLDWEYTSKGVFNRDEKVVRSIANLIAKSEHVLIRAYNYEDQPVDGAFSVAGGESQLRTVFRACGYAFDQPLKSNKK
jgi:hypothetical protein